MSRDWLSRSVVTLLRVCLGDPMGSKMLRRSHEPSNEDNETRREGQFIAQTLIGISLGHYHT